MSKFTYEQFKIETLRSKDVIKKANKMRAVSDDFADGFEKAMWEAREIYMKLDGERDE